jgi:hypothetical protein
LGAYVDVTVAIGVRITVVLGSSGDIGGYTLITAADVGAFMIVNVGAKATVWATAAVAGFAGVAIFMSSVVS